jgi:two-component system CheB/CheR fusion protein
MCSAEGEGEHYPIDEAGVWVDCVGKRGPVVHNDYEGLAHKRGLPEGHAPVIRELVVPVIRGVDVRSILGVGNKETDYTETDVETVSSLADLAWDIVERKRAEEALRQSEERYQALIDNLPEVFATVDANGRITFVSQRVQELWGYSPKEVYEGPPDLWRGSIHPADRERVLAAFADLFDRGIPFDVEYRLRRKDGSWIWVNDRANTTHEEENVHYAYAVSSDITEKKRLERQVIQISEWERRRIGQDLHDDLGQHLTGMAAICSGLRVRLGREGHAEEANAARLEDLSRSALLHTRNLARGLSPQDVTGRTLPDTLHLLGDTTEAVFGIPCGVRVLGDLAEVQDETALHLFRISQESVHNSVKHGSPKNLSIRLEANVEGITLRIEDDGAGFNPDGGGEGMGLPIMKRRVRLLGGRFELESSPGHGTRTTVSIPRRSGLSGPPTGERK